MKRAVAIAGMLLALVACEARAEITVKPDGSGSLGFLLSIDKTTLTALKGFGQGEDPFAEMKSSLKDSPVEFAVTESEENGGKTLHAVAPFKTVEEFRTITRAGGAGGAFGDDSLQNVTLERSGAGWRFSAEAPAGGLGGPSGGDGLPSFDPSDLADVFQISFRVTLPGRSTSTTANETERDGGSTTFIWKPDLKDPKSIMLVAQTTGGSAATSFPIVPVAAAGAGLAVALALGAAAASRTRAAALIAAPPEDAAPATPPVEPPAP